MKTSEFNAVVVLACFIALVLACSSGNQSGNQTSSYVSYAGTILVQAPDLIQAYEENEVARRREMQRQKTSGFGNSETIGKDIANTMYVTLSGGEEYGIRVQCMFEDTFKSKLAELHKGDRVTIIGVCDGKFGNVLLRRSEIPKF